MNQPAPKISAADVERIIARDFSAEQVAPVRAALAEYGTKAWHAEPDRVRVAILKMADGDSGRLRNALAAADQDYRDVLSAAEYPRYAQQVSPSEKNEIKRLLAVDDDWRQYREWFERKGRPGGSIAG